MTDPNTYSGADDMTIVHIFRLLLRYKWLIVAVAVIGSVLGVLRAVTMTPVYRSSTEVAHVGEAEQSPFSRFGSQFEGLASLTGASIGAASKKYEALAILNSRHFTQGFIEDNDLLPVLFAEHWDDSTNTWSVEDGEDLPTIADAYEIFDKSVRRVSEDKTSGLITLSIEWSDPEFAAAWANELIARANREISNREIDLAQRSLEYLETELAGTANVDIKQGIYRLMETQISNVVMANVRKDFAFRVLDPAIPAGPDDYFKPRPLMMTVVSGVLGLVLGVAFALLIELMRAVKRGER